MGCLCSRVGNCDIGTAEDGISDGHGRAAPIQFPPFGSISPIAPRVWSEGADQCGRLTRFV